MERKDSAIVVAFAFGVAAGSIWSTVRRMDRWNALNEADRVDEEHEALTNFIGTQFDGFVNVLNGLKTRLDDVATLVGERRRGGVTTLPPRDGG